MKPLKENPKASIEDDEMDDYEDPLPTIEDVKWFLDAQKFKPKEVMDTEYIATKIYEYYENFAPEFDDEDLDMDEHNMKLAREYQEYYMNKRKNKVKEEIGTATAMEDLAIFVEAVETMIDDLRRVGFEPEDVKSYLINLWRRRV